jgi:hypothetical protein
MALKLACPRCREAAFYDDEWAGKTVTCAKCAQMFRVPGLQSEAAPIAAPEVSLGPLAARPVPLSFAPPEPLSTRAVPLDDNGPAGRPAARPEARPSRLFDDNEGEDRRRPARRPRDEDVDLTRPRRRPASEAPPRISWLVGVSFIAFFMLLFVGTALWFMLKQHRPPVQAAMPRGGFGGGFQQQPAPPMPMPGPGGMGGMPGRPPIPPQGPVIPAEEEQPIHVELDANGELKEKNRIAPNDTLDVEPDPANHPQRRFCHRRVFLIELDGPRKYTFEMQMHPPRRGPFFNRNNFPSLDPWLRIEDEQGKPLFFNDDIILGNELNSRIQERIPAKGTYRVICTTCDDAQTGEFFLVIRDEDRGKPVAAKKLPALALPKPADVKEQLKSTPQQRRDTHVTRIELAGEPLVGELCWSKDAKAVLALDAAGLLRRIAVPGFVEEKRLELGQPAGSLTMCSAGLLAGFEKQEEVWLIDPDRLEVVRRISAPGLERVAASPALPFAYATARRPGAPLPGVAVMVLDVVKGVPVRQYELPAKHLTASPDGKYVFAEGGIEQLLRFRVQNSELVLEEESPRIASRGQGVVVSPDSKFVCLPSANGNYTGVVQPPAQPFSTFVYAVANLRTPAFIIHSGQSPRTLGFDPKTGNVLAHNFEKELIVLDQQGKRLHEHNVPGKDRLVNEPRQFLVHPDGNKLLIRAERDLFWVEFGKAD